MTAPGPKTPDITVVVPTRDRPDSLRACMSALGAQPDVRAEIVVVDDASMDPEVVAAAVATAPNSRVIRGEGRGPAAARNLGARHAATPIVCFTDDDCRPVPGWLSALRERIDSGADAVAGPMRNGRTNDPFATAAQTVTNHLTEWSHDPSAGTVRFAPTSNLAVRADVLAELPFDESFPLAAGEDRDWCDRLAASGRTLAFEPTAVVDHHPDLGWRGFWRQQVRYGRGSQHLRSTGAGPGMQPPRFYLDLVREGFAHGPAAGALVLVAQVATAVGIARELATTTPD
ncbi:MAG: glycosyltransferase [Acidimicrobiales bacterium]|nr:glycosyltransferase [Acidimicrobiales bacterium]